MNLQLSIEPSRPIRGPGRSSTVPEKPDGIDLDCHGVHPSELFQQDVRRIRRFGNVVSVVSDRGDRRSTRALSVCRSSRRRDFSTPVSWCGAPPALPSPPTSKASGSARSGAAACCSTNSPSHRNGILDGARAEAAPRGVVVEQIPAEKGVRSMMLSGELDAVWFSFGRDLVDRSRLILRPTRISTISSRSDRGRHPLLQQDRALAESTTRP